MQFDELLGQSGGLQSIARELGISEHEAASGAQSLLPAILGGLKKQDGLGGVLAQLGGGGLLDDVLAPEPTDVGRGNDVLGRIFGSKDVSRTVAQSAASRSGLSADLLKKMLPIVAMLAAGYLAKRGSTSAPSSGLGGMLGGLLGGGDGNALDDIMALAGKVLR